MKSRRSIRDWLLLYGAFLVYSVSSVFAKLTSGQDSLWKMALMFGLEIVFLGVYALIWQQALKRFPLSTAMSNKGVTVIFGLLWSVLLFHETITLPNLLGAALIVGGIVLVTSDE